MAISGARFTIGLDGDGIKEFLGNEKE